jgi:hypothetical protein
MCVTSSLHLIRHSDECYVVRVLYEPPGHTNVWGSVDTAPCILNLRTLWWLHTPDRGRTLYEPQRRLELWRRDKCLPLTGTEPRFPGHLSRHCVPFTSLTTVTAISCCSQWHCIVCVFCVQQCSCFMNTVQHTTICALQLLAPNQPDIPLVPPAGETKQSV